MVHTSRAFPNKDSESTTISGEILPLVSRFKQDNLPLQLPLVVQPIMKLSIRFSFGNHSRHTQFWYL